MRTVAIDLAERSYPIYIGGGLLADHDLLTSHLHGSQVMVVTNEVVAPLYLDALTGALADRELRTLVLPDGEQQKSMAVLESVLDALLEARFARDCTVVALGGGVVGDLAGFAAACYQRGVAFMQVPTTLLAQVDSSVGGKTAVNHALGKNMIGAFYQPVCVLADIDTLRSLPRRELGAGVAEVIKYGLIRDFGFLEWLERHVDGLMRADEDLLAEAVERSCVHKALVVGADEREAGVRATLNFGHSFGHAIENGLGYGEWLHGEAVAAGMVMACDLSARMGWLDWQDVARVRRLLERAGLPLWAPPSLAPERMLELMGADKKVLDGRLRLVLLEGLGKAVVTGEYDPDALRQTLGARDAPADAGVA